MPGLQLIKLMDRAAAHTAREPHAGGLVRLHAGDPDAPLLPTHPPASGVVDEAAMPHPVRAGAQARQILGLPGDSISRCGRPRLRRR